MNPVLVAGSAVVDFVFAVDALPDAPRKYRARGARIVGGGCAANAAVAICRLGGRALLAARLGDDPAGRWIAAGLAAEAVDTALTVRAPGGATACSPGHVDARGERQIVNFRGGNLPDMPAWTLPPLDAVLADTRWPEAAVAAMRTARARGIPGVMDAETPQVPEALRLASHVAFSRQGFDAFAGGRTLARVRRDLGGWVCVTDGSAGVRRHDGTSERHIPAFPVRAVDTLAAGDVWHGAFVLALARGTREDDAVRFANATAALKCTRAGGREGAPTAAEVAAFLAERSADAPQPR